MSQTPTKGPYKVEELNDSSFHVRHHGKVTPVSFFRLEEDATFLAEALNIHHETKQTPRQILESREALRAALQGLSRAYINLLEAGKDRIESLGGDCDSVPMMEASCAELRVAKEALTLAKEGGPK